MRIEELYQLYKRHPSVQTDSRKIEKGDLFFALRGDQFNGNEFAQRAIDLGASFAVVDEAAGLGIPTERFVRVENALKCLQELAGHHRRQLSIPVLAITGSNGKTTTKELIHAVLSTTYNTYSTVGNLNNHIGIPLTLLKIRDDAQMAVVEMGANHLGEIAGYCTYTDPSHGLITNCGKAHLEGFGSEEGVRKGKGELFDYLRAHGGTAFVNWDYPYLRDMSRGIHATYSYGTQEASLVGTITQSDPTLEVKITKGMPETTLTTQLAGDYNLPNILAAAAVGAFFHVESSRIKSAIENYLPSNSRSQLLLVNSNRVLLDAYNANPSSMRAAVENFARLDSDNKVLMLGAMAELGRQSLLEHQQLLQLIGKHAWRRVVLVGGDFLKLKHPYIQFEDSLQAQAWFKQQDIHDALVLIKGSRNMKMERILDP